jgi:hypothetical protein
MREEKPDVPAIRRNRMPKRWYRRIDRRMALMSLYLLIFAVPFVCGLVGWAFVWNTPKTAYESKPLPDISAWREEKPLRRAA